MAIILDISVILFIVLSIISCFRAGFVKIVLRIITNIVAFFFAFMIAKYISSFIYDVFVSDFLLQKANEFNFNSDEIATLKDSMDKLPDALHNALQSMGVNIDSVINTLNNGVSDVGLFVVNNLLRPIAILLISNVLVIFIYALLTPLIKLILNKLHIINKIPVIGSINKYIGAIGGFVIGTIDWIFMCYIVNVFIIFTTDTSPYLNSSIVQGTHIFKLIYNIGLF